MLYREEGVDYIKSLWPLWIGLGMCYNGGNSWDA